MKILVVTQRFHPAIGGAEVMLRRLAATWVRLGCQVVVLTQRQIPNLPATEDLDGFKIIRLPTLKWRFLGTVHYIASLRRQLAASEGAFNVVFVSMFKHAAYAALTTKWRKPPPIVLRAEGAGPTGDMEWQDTARFGKRIRLACQRADAFIAPSPQIADELRARGYRPGAIHEILNGVPIPEKPWRSERTSRFRQELGLPDRPMIVYTGRLHLEKGLNDLIDAAAVLHREGRPLSLCVVGEGPERDSLQLRASDAGIADSLILPGVVLTVEPWLRAADLFVLPSYQEGLSVSLLEALAIGMPCLASDIPANVGLVPEGMLPHFPIRDPKQLAAAIRDRLDGSLKGLNDQRRIVAEKFGIETTGKGHLEVFGKVAGSPRS
jgi:glycosyltransferase involved in cell wall biosynthesis